MRDLAPRAASLREPTESQECVLFLDWAALVRFDGEPLIDRIVRIPNERRPGVMTAVLTKLGMRKGFPDYAVLVPLEPYAGLFLEAKRVRGGRAEPEQLAWREKLRSWGYDAHICEGGQRMIQCTHNYLSLLAPDRFVDRTEGVLT